MSNCTACDKGWYCDAPGLLQPRAPCDPGYLCYGGAKESAPTDGVSGELCSAGGYCPLGEFKLLSFYNNNNNIDFYIEHTQSPEIQIIVLYNKDILTKKCKTHVILLHI